jgi:hypothetical protein
MQVLSVNALGDFKTKGSFSAANNTISAEVGLVSMENVKISSSLVSYDARLFYAQWILNSIVIENDVLSVSVCI